jgi:transposase
VTPGQRHNRLKAAAAAMVEVARTLDKSRETCTRQGCSGTTFNSPDDRIAYGHLLHALRELGAADLTLGHCGTEEIAWAD